ncbi:hypothetical protein U1Q18_016981 [Sarracenia purpurea var. burkii]
MAFNSSDENPWGNPQPESGKPGLFEKKTLSRRVSENFEKTKAAASTGMKKVKDGVKDGASASAYWMKLKYNNVKNNHKK